MSTKYTSITFNPALIVCLSSMINFKFNRYTDSGPDTCKKADQFPHKIRLYIQICGNIKLEREIPQWNNSTAYDTDINVTTTVSYERKVQTEIADIAQPLLIYVSLGERKRPTCRSRGLHTNILNNQFSINRTISNACSCVNRWVHVSWISVY